ncbi:MAG: M23 family metallopeptidase [Oscillospiraceae bacterium]|nr:M23 family metallopeptidase [Oscillospiraceae bacterium]
MHRGIDIAAPFDAPILAVASGVVTFVGYERGGFGNWISIDHQNGFQTRYAHNARNLVRVGDRVFQGQRIADVGSTGLSSGPHLHFEVLVDGAWTDPLQFFPESMFRIR